MPCSELGTELFVNCNGWKLAEQSSRIGSNAGECEDYAKIKCGLARYSPQPKEHEISCFAQPEWDRRCRYRAEQHSKKQR